MVQTGTLRGRVADLALAFTLCAAIGCGGETSSTGPNGPNGAAGGASASPQAEQDFIAGYCALAGGCCATVGAPYDATLCAQFATSLVKDQRYDPVLGGRCLQAVSSAAGLCTNNNPGPAECELVFQSLGTAALGAACTADGDCAPSTEGRVQCQYGQLAGQSIQKCQVSLTGIVGSAPCIATRDGAVTYNNATTTDVTPRGYVCDRSQGLYCNGTACAPLVSVGGACSGPHDCVASAYCGQTQTCVARGAAGAACIVGLDACAPGTYCGAGTLLCTQTSGAGAPCGESQQCSSHSCVSGACGGNVPINQGIALLCNPSM